MNEQCPFAKNPFCSAISAQALARFCEHCRLKSYAAKTIHSFEYWNRGPVVLVKGFAGFGSVVSTTANPFTTRTFCYEGEFISWGGCIMQAEPELDEDRMNSIYLFSDCTLAFLDKHVLEDLLNTDPEFNKFMIHQLVNGWGRAEAPLCCDTAKEKLRYYLTSWKRHGIGSLTHDQIAIACNLSRPTVTKLLSELTATEPDLFVGQFSV